MSGGNPPPSTITKEVSKKNDCETLNITVNLHSPVEDVIEQIQINSELTIQFDTPTHNVVALYDYEIAGTIVGKDGMRIKNCIDKGFEFIAVVVALSGGNCKIKITNR